MTMNEITPVNSTALMSFIERAAINPDFDVQKFGELLRMQREMEHDQSRRAFNQAMASAQAAMPPVVRSATNKHLGNKYAKLEDVDREMRPIYTEHGFSVRFGSAPAAEGYIRITCTVAHSAGYFEENYLDAPTNNVGSQGGRTASTGVQAVGSAVTYLRRYLLGMVFNIVLADDDDDGESQRGQWERPRNAAARTPPPERRVDPTVYDAEPPGTPAETDEERWKRNLVAKLALAQSRDDVVAVGSLKSVHAAQASGIPELAIWVTQVLNDAFAKFPIEKETAPSDDLAEVHIVGEEHLAAG
jgi:hypothetical protein